MNKKTDITDFNAIVKEYHCVIFRTAIGFVHLREDAEDITQEAFIKAYQNHENFRGESEISTWLYRITVNLSLNFIAQKQRKSFLQITSDLFNNLINSPDDTKNPNELLEESEEKVLIQKAIDSLPEKQRIAFILTRYDDLPQKDVAGIMQISQRAVEQLLLRAKINLNKKLAQTIRK